MYVRIICIILLFMFRLTKLNELMAMLEMYSSLGLSHIEGIEAFNNRFNVAFTSLRKKPYDVLDQRKSDFDFDFDDFKKQVSDLCVSSFIQ